MITTLLALAATWPALEKVPFRCGAVERPGIAERGDDGVWRGLAVDLCRQAAQAEHGAGATIAFHPYRRIDDLRDAGRDDLAVLSHAELAIAWPVRGPRQTRQVAVNRQVLLVRAGAKLRNRADIAGQRVCFIVASQAESALNAWARPAGIALLRAGFQEPVELRDAFDAGYCTAMAVDAQDIPGGAARMVELGPPLAELPLFAIMTPSR